MLDLLKKNKEMLDNNKYNASDTRKMLDICNLLPNKVNDYDLYLIACALCNYDIPEKAEARNLRMQYFLSTNKGQISGFEHTIDDYNATTPVKSSITCINTHKINMYSLYEYNINKNSKDLVNELWSYKAKDCLKYVNSKISKDFIIVSISFNQFNNFIKMLDALKISYDINDLQVGEAFTNASGNSLVDISKMDLPFTPYDFQIEDANKIVKMKRALIGHDMGLGKSFLSILVGSSIKTTKYIDVRNINNLDYNTILITDKGPLPIGKIVEENIDCKIQITINNKTKFVDIIDRNCETA